MKWINKHLENIALFSVVGAVLWVIFGPILLTQTNFTIIDFSSGQNNTGAIGDTIGGITAPVVGLISVILLYLALIKQIESNKISVHEANFRIVYAELTELKNIAERYSYDNKIGADAITKTVSDIGLKEFNKQLTNNDYIELARFDLILNNFNKIFYLLDNLKTSDEYKDILSKDLQNIFVLNFNSAYNLMLAQWQVSENDFNDLVKGKMYEIKMYLEVVFADIIKRNRNN